MTVFNIDNKMKFWRIDYEQNIKTLRRNFFLKNVGRLALFKVLKCYKEIAIFPNL